VDGNEVEGNDNKLNPNT